MIVNIKDMERLKEHIKKVDFIYDDNISELDADTVEDAFKEGINVALQALDLATVSNQRELLIAFAVWLDKNDKYLENGNITETVNEYLSNL